MKNNLKFFQFEEKLGLTKKDLSRLIDNSIASTEQSSNSLGGPNYPGGFYGTISVNDFN